MKEIRGIIPILNTPFDTNNEVDKDDMLRQLNYGRAKRRCRYLRGELP